MQDANKLNVRLIEDETDPSIPTKQEARNTSIEEGELPQTNPIDIPKIGAKPGWKTSQGQMTALFVVVSMIFAALGYNSFTPEKIENIYQMISAVLPIVIPLLGSIPVLGHYINSRGKIASNELWGSVALSSGIMQQGSPLAEARGIAGGPWGSVGKVVGGILGGDNWQDPDRYINIGRIGSQIIPGGQVVGKVLDNIGGQQNPGERKLTDAEIIKAFDAMNANDLALNDQLKEIKQMLQQKQG